MTEIETVELFAPNTSNRRVIINDVQCYEWEFQGILYYPTVEFVPYEENPCLQAIKEVYDSNGKRVGTLEWNHLDLGVNEYDLLNRNTNFEYIWNTRFPTYFILKNYYGNKYIYNLETENLVKFQFNTRFYNEQSRQEKFQLLLEFQEIVDFNGYNPNTLNEDELTYHYSLRRIMTFGPGIFHICQIDDETPLYLESEILLK